MKPNTDLSAVPPSIQSYPVRLPVLSILAGVIFLTSCSSSKSVATSGGETDTKAVETTNAGVTYVWVTPTGSTLRNTGGEELAYIGSGGTVIYSATSLSGASVVYASDTDGRIEFTYVDISSGASRVLHRGRAPLVYSGAWSPDEQSFAFGYYSPVEGQGRNEIGSGGIKILNLGNGQIRDAGCTSSQVVITWPSDNTVMVRNNDNLYGVSPTDCATQKTIDIRKWHRITPSPDGAHLAYILRDLAYNPDTRNYEPDSMLYVTATGQDGGTLIVGDRFRPRNMAWAPNGAELAFDVLEKVGDEKRVIFIYRVAEDRRYVMTPPSEVDPSQSHPMWDDSSQYISYMADGNTLMVRSAESNFATPMDLGEGQGAAKRVTGWAGPEMMFIQNDSGQEFLYTLKTGTIKPLGPGTVVIRTRSVRPGAR